MATSILLIAGAYLLGAIPSAYLLARHVKGIDIRQHGSGNMGATNVMNHVGMLSGWLLGAFDCVVKGSLPVFVGGLLDVGLDVRVGAGLAAIAGHNWSPYVRFTGGRGVATTVGVLFGFCLWPEPRLWPETLILAGLLDQLPSAARSYVVLWPEFLILGVLMGGFGRLLFRDTGFWTLLAIITLPVLALLFERPAPIVYMAIGIPALLMLKRLTGNWEMPPAGHSVPGVLINRALWDRDVRQKAPSPEGASRPASEAKLDVRS